MASRVLLLLASALLGAPGVTSACSDLPMVPLNDGDQLLPVLAQGGPQADLPTPWERKGVTCRLCQAIMRQLLDMVGEQPDEDAIAKAESRVCRTVKAFLRGLCKRIMRKYLPRISADIMAGKEPRAICEDVRRCKAPAGLPSASGSTRGRKHKISSPRSSWPLLPS